MIFQSVGSYQSLHASVKQAKWDCCDCDAICISRKSRFGDETTWILNKLPCFPDDLVPDALLALHYERLKNRLLRNLRHLILNHNNVVMCLHLRARRQRVNFT